MKKKVTALLTMLFMTGAVLSASAGVFENYNDYENEDGTYSYYFMQGVTVTMDQEWYQNTRVIIDEDGAGFYHTDSYEKYQEEGMTGGLLFTIGASVNSDFQELPSFRYIGFDEAQMMNYYAQLPSDYQAYMEDEEIKAEYDALWAGVEDVIAGISLDGAENAAASSMLTGGWTAKEDTEVPEEVAEALKSALTSDGPAYEPAALLATQVVAGTNYCLLCRSGEEAERTLEYVLVYLYVDLEGNAQILDAQALSFGIR